VFRDWENWHVQNSIFSPGRVKVMKRLLITIAAVLMSASTFAQGTVNFNNFVGTQANPIVNAPVFVSGGNVGVGSIPGATAQLFLVTGSGASVTYTPVGQTSGFRNATAGNPLLNAYIVGNNSMDIGQPAGSTVNVVMRVWVGESYDAAVAGGGLYTFSNIIPITLGGVTDPTLPAEFPAALVGLQFIPEPSTIALGVLGAAALLYRRRM
jgi:hypothetical protein